VVKDREVVATTVSFEELKKYFVSCAGVETSDFMHILYHSNPSFKNTFELILPP
jgi:hypothetical protein